MAYDPLSIIQSADPELRTEIASSHALALGEGGDLSVKHKLLIALALDTAMHSEGGVRSLALQALEAGATKAEIMDALRVAYYICGVGGIYTAARALDGVL